MANMLALVECTFLKRANGILLIYNHLPVDDAPTIIDHLESFSKYSQFKVWKVNALYGFPSFLKDYEFSTIVLHYSQWGGAMSSAAKPLYDWLEQQNSHKIQFCQDENYNCGYRFSFINRMRIDWIYSPLAPKYHQQIYGLKCPQVKKVFHTLCGYVSDNMVAKANRFYKPNLDRPLDVGYRGRVLPPYLGRGAMEKQEMGLGFLARANGSGLKLDIDVNEQHRLYGDDWYRWLSNCKTVLGVEGGGSIFDVDDEVWNEYWKKPRSYEEMPQELMKKYDGKVFYQHFTPRHLEAAASRTLQVLFEGNYYGIMKPWEHYVPLKKDFSNFNEVVQSIKNFSTRMDIISKCYRDLIESQKFTYRKFIGQFDQNLLDAGFSPSIEPELASQIEAQLNAYVKSQRIHRALETLIAATYHKQFLGRNIVAKIYHTVRQ